jgi:hypothetical protein
MRLELKLESQKYLDFLRFPSGDSIPKINPLNMSKLQATNNKNNNMTQRHTKGKPKSWERDDTSSYKRGNPSLTSPCSLAPRSLSVPLGLDIRHCRSHGPRALPLTWHSAPLETGTLFSRLLSAWRFHIPHNSTGFHWGSQALWKGRRWNRMGKGCSWREGSGGYCTSSPISDIIFFGPDFNVLKARCNESLFEMFAI